MVRPENRKDRRLKENQSTERRVVIVMREREGRTVTAVARHEAEAEGVARAEARVARGTKVYADEAGHWDAQHRTFPNAGRINHSEAYSADGANTNQAESYFAHLRRMVAGQHHYVSAHYLARYAAEAAWEGGQPPPRQRRCVPPRTRPRDVGRQVRRSVWLLAAPSPRREGGLMADPHVVSQLRTKQAELQGAVSYYEGKLAEARANLMHVNATLRLFELPEDGAGQFPTHINLTRVFPRGEVMALTIAALRDHGAPMTSRAIAAEIVRRKGWDTKDPVLQRGITAKLHQTLRKALQRRQLSEHGFKRGARVWGLPS